MNDSILIQIIEEQQQKLLTAIYNLILDNKLTKAIIIENMTLITS